MTTKKINALFSQDLQVLNLGLTTFAENLSQKGVSVVHVDWRPPAGGDPQLLKGLDDLLQRQAQKIAEANSVAVKKILGAKPRLVGVGTALESIPHMQRDLFLHAGPPVTWEKMSGPMRGAVIGGLIYEGRAQTPEEAERLAAQGAIAFAPCHHHLSVGPMAGVITPSMPVMIFKNEAEGNHAYITFNEGLGKVLRYGAYGEEVNARLKWMEQVLAPMIKQVLDLTGPIDMKLLLSQALQMGDEGHNRNRAGTSLFIREIAPQIVKLKARPDDISAVLKFIHQNDHFFLNLSMGAAKCTADAASGIPHSTLVSTMARNGTEFGIRISGLGDRWFTAPAPRVDGLYLPGFCADDAAPDIGDSVITETVGIGGFAMAAAPAIVKFVGGSAQDALNTTRHMFSITLAENTGYQIPALNFRGTPTGIDLFKILTTGILPAINTGIAHHQPGIGMVGAGLVKPPIHCFLQAAEAFIEQYGK